MIAKKDDSYLVAAEAARALGATRQKAAYRTLVSVLDAPSWADVRRAGALDGLAWLGDDRAVDHVRRRSEIGVPSRGRRAAITALAGLSEDKKTREHLETLLDDADPHLRITVVRALESLDHPKARSALRRRLEREDDGRVARRIREALRDLRGKAAEEKRRVNDDLVSLRRQLSELEIRLSKIEQQSKPKKASRRGR
jgi:aminopeptidase N